nr:hypothetical protein [uncultured Anaerotignum sp.]
MDVCKYRVSDRCMKSGFICTFDEKCFDPEEKPVQTNADRIRSMSDEELVAFLDNFGANCMDCAKLGKNPQCEIYKEGFNCGPEDIMEWLRKTTE